MSETTDATRPYAIRLMDGYHAALQCRNDDHAIQRGHDLARKHGAALWWVRTVVLGEARKLVYGKGAY